jgi:hypothetical protein
MNAQEQNKQKKLQELRELSGASQARRRAYNVISEWVAVATLCFIDNIISWDEAAQVVSEAREYVTQLGNDPTSDVVAQRVTEEVSAKHIALQHRYLGIDVESKA